MRPEDLFRRQVRPHLVLGAPQIAFPIRIWVVAVFGILFAAATVFVFLFVPFSSKHRLSGHIVPSSGLVDVRSPASLRVISSPARLGAKVSRGGVLASACELRPEVGGPTGRGGASSIVGAPDEHCTGVISLVAPVAGSISYASLAPGIELREGELAASIIPEGHEIVAAVFVPAQALSSLEIGDTLRLRVAGLPYQQHGQINGVVRSISVSPREGSGAGLSGTEPFYRVEVALQPRDQAQRSLKDRIMVGMAVNADLRAESRTLAQRAF